MREEIKLLKDHAGFSANFLDITHIMGEFDAINDDLTLLVFLQAVERANERRFS